MIPSIQQTLPEADRHQFRMLEEWRKWRLAQSAYSQRADGQDSVKLAEMRMRARVDTLAGTDSPTIRQQVENILEGIKHAGREVQRYDAFLAIKQLRNGLT